MMASRQAAFVILFVAFWAAVERLGAHLRQPYSGYETVWMRYVVHITFMLVAWGWRSPMLLVHTRRPTFQLARSLLMFVMPASFIVGIQNGVEPGTITVFLLLSSLLILIFAACFLGEAIPLSIWLWGIGLAIGAFLLIVLKEVSSLPALIFPFATVASFSLYVVMTRSLRTENELTNLFYTAAGVVLILSPVIPQVWLQPDAHDWLIFLGIGLFGFASLLALDRAATDGPVSNSTPILGALFAITILTDFMPGGHSADLACMAVLLLAIVAAHLLLKRDRQTSSREAA